MFPHATGRWAKKVRGKLVYFGKIEGDEDGQIALNKWLDQRDDLLAGRTPRVVSVAGVTVRDLCNRFLTAKEGQRDRGDITSRTFDDYHRTCVSLVEVIGKNRIVVDLGTEDFERLHRELAKTLGPVALGNEIQRVRVAFKFAYDSGLLASPIRFGPTFKRPSRKVLRRERAKKGPRMFEARHIRRLLKAAGTQQRAMILLAINCGLGNADCALLPFDALDLRRAWLRYPRPKTGVDRRCPLWPETIEALKAAIVERPTPKDAALEERVFVTKYGGTWFKETTTNPVSQEFGKLLRSLDLHKPGLGFYGIRHTTQTIGDGARDPVATSFIMGHVGDDMSTVYRERIDDSRLLAVSQHVHRWLFRGLKEWPRKRLVNLE